MITSPRTPEPPVPTRPDATAWGLVGTAYRPAATSAASQSAHGGHAAGHRPDGASELRGTPGGAAERGPVREALAYLAAVAGTVAAVVWSMQLWRADLRIPFDYSGDAVSSAAHVKATVQWGWYEHQADLGAPAGQNYHVYPFGDHLPLLFAKVAGWFTSSWPLVFNAYYLLGFPLAAVTGLWFLRRCGVSRAFAVAGAVLFAVAPYHWMRGESHYYLSGYWPVPVLIWVGYVVLRGANPWQPARSAGPRAGWWDRPALRAGALVVALAVAATSASYYAAFGAVLIVGCAVVAFLVHRSWRVFAGALAAAGLVVLVMLVNVLPDILWQQGHPGSAVDRARGDAEVYALKITSLLMPAPGHRVELLGSLRNRYDAGFPLPSEQPALGAAAALGLVVAGLVCAAAVARAARGVGTPTRPLSGTVDAGRAASLTAVSGLACAMVAVATVGGLGTLVSFVEPSLRGWNRMSIFIALPCLAAVGLAGRSVADRLAAALRIDARLVAGVLAVTLLSGGVYDQAIVRATSDYAGVGQSWRSDDAFVAAVETAVGPTAALLQLPYVAFPESGRHGAAYDSDAVKLSLHSTTLRWSGGALRGQDGADAIAALTALPAADLVPAAVAAGYQGVVVDRDATDSGATPTAELLAPVLGAPEITSPDGRWSLYRLPVS